MVLDSDRAWIRVSPAHRDDVPSRRWRCSAPRRERGTSTPVRTHPRFTRSRDFATRRGRCSTISNPSNSARGRNLLRTLRSHGVTAIVINARPAVLDPTRTERRSRSCVTVTRTTGRVAGGSDPLGIASTPSAAHLRGGLFSVPPRDCRRRGSTGLSKTTRAAKSIRWSAVSEAFGKRRELQPVPQGIAIPQRSDLDSLEPGQPEQHVPMLRCEKSWTCSMSKIGERCLRRRAVKARRS